MSATLHGAERPVSSHLFQPFHLFRLLRLTGLFSFSVDPVSCIEQTVGWDDLDVTSGRETGVDHDKPSGSVTIFVSVRPAASRR